MKAKELWRKTKVTIAVAISIVTITACGQQDETIQETERESIVETQVETQTELESKTETVTDSVEEMMEDSSKGQVWIKAYQDFLNDKTNLIKLVKKRDDYFGSTVRQIYGFVLHDMNQDGVPELLIASNPEFFVDVYSYSTVIGQVEYCGFTGGGENIFEYGYSNSKLGFDKVTGKIYEYLETGEENENGVIEEIYLCLSNLKMSVNSDYFQNTDTWWSECLQTSSDWKGVISLSEVRKTDKDFLPEKDNIIPFCDLMKVTSETETVNAETAKEAVKNFLPFEWHKVENKEIESYISEDYQKKNLQVKFDYSKAIVSDRIDKYYDKDEWIRSLKSDKLVTIKNENENYYFDLETFYLGKAVCGTQKSGKVKVDAPDGYVNFRTGHGTDYAIISEIHNGVELEIVETDSSKKWIAVWYDNQFGWISRSQVSFTDDGQIVANDNNEENTGNTGSTNKLFDSITSENAEYQGSCGADAKWYYKDNVLVIKGTGVITNAGWKYKDGLNYEEEIHSIIVGEGITGNTDSFTETDWWNSRFNNVSEVVLPSTFTSIGDNAFQGCTSLGKIDIPDSVTKIGEGAFEGCSSLREIRIPDGVTIIEDSTFDECKDLIKVHIPNGVTKIGGGAFHKTALYEIDIPNSVTEIGNAAFAKCEYLEKFSIPEGVTKIEDYTFFGCLELSEIHIPNSVIEIGDYVFDGCFKLSEIHIPNSVIKIGEDAFMEDTNVIY